MSNWWDNGLKCKDGNQPTSDGKTAVLSVFPVITGFRKCGSVVFTENVESIGGEQVYSQLLCTMNNGTQIFVKIRETLRSESIRLYNPDTYSWNQRGWTTKIELRKPGGTTLEFGSYVTGDFNRIVAGDPSIYNRNIIRSNPTVLDASGNYDESPTAWAPRGGAAAGTTQEYTCLSEADGLHFYFVGFNGLYQNTRVENPCQEMGYIPVSALNNPFWFDPTADGLTPAERGDEGDPDDRPTDFGYSGTDIDFPPLPSGDSALGFGRMTIFQPTATQLGNALDILWSDVDESVVERILESLKKFVYKPEKYCISLMLSPVSATGTSKRIYFGKYDTEVNATALSSQYQIVDCGSLSIPLKYGSALDYGPYAKAMIFLPYVGFRPININEIMGGTITCKYYVDMFNGTALCMLKISNKNSNTSILYTYDCNVAQQIPITAESYDRAIQSYLGCAGGAAATAGALLSGNIPLAIGTLGGTVAASASTVANILAPDMQQSGNFNSNTGALGPNKPYVVIHFPVPDKPNDYNHQIGSPSNKSVSLGSLSGFNIVEAVHLDGISATAVEKQMIDTALKAGVVF